MHMIFFVLDDPDLLGQILTAWEVAGIRGATIVESSGFHRRSKHIAMRYTFDSGMEEEGHLTLFAIVPDEASVQACLSATESVTGNLDNPNSGVFAAWPISIVKGVPNSGERQ